MHSKAGLMMAFACARFFGIVSSSARRCLVATIVLSSVVLPPPLQAASPWALEAIRLESLRTPKRYLVPQGELAKSRSILSEPDRSKSAFYVVPGLAQRDCVSFESVNRRGHYLRHQDFVLKLHAPDGSQLFLDDATFCIRPGLADAAQWSFESFNYPGFFIQQLDGGFVIAEPGKGVGDLTDTTFRRVVVDDSRQFRGVIDSRKGGWVDTGLDVTTMNSLTIRVVGGNWSVDAARYAPVGGNGHRDEGRTDLRNWMQFKPFQRAHFGSLLASINRDDIFLAGDEYRNMPPSVRIHPPLQPQMRPWRHRSEPLSAVLLASG